jgi:hypothetical protein
MVDISRPLFVSHFSRKLACAQLRRGTCVFRKNVVIACSIRPDTTRKREVPEPEEQVLGYVESTDALSITRARTLGTTFSLNGGIHPE